MKIDGIELKHGLFLAPMAGATDRAFRRVCRERGAEFTVSEMVSAKALCFEQKSPKFATRSKSAPLACVLKEENPMAVQLFGHEPDLMAEAARMIAACDYMGCQSEVPPVAIDINMGCPVPKVVANGEGSALMKDIPLATEIIKAVVNAVDLPVTVKMRAGWDENSINAPELARAAEAAGAKAIFVHCRTRKQMYSPGANPEIVRLVKQSVRIPVIGNGDIYTPEDAVRMMNDTGCDGVMIGRGALGNPWIFEQIKRKLAGQDERVITIGERVDVCKKHLLSAIDWKGERQAIMEMRKHYGGYFKGIVDFKQFRIPLVSYSTLEELLPIFDAIVNYYGDSPDGYSKC